MVQTDCQKSDKDYKGDHVIEIEIRKLTLKEKLKRGHFLYFGYYWLYEKYYDRLIAKKDMSRMLPNDATFPVQSLDYRILRLFEKEFTADDRDLTVDVGSGWGRTLGFLLLKKNKGRFIGIEINREAAEFSKKVFSANERVGIFNGDAVEIVPPDATKLILFNPFPRKVLSAFLDTVELRCGDGVLLYYLNPEYEAELTERGCWILKEKKTLCPKYHIPVHLSVYRLYDRGDCI